MNRWGNLNMEQKAQLLGIYASKGYTDLASIINHYNTFQAGGRLTFNEWKSQMQSKYPDIEMDNTKAGYDYVRYFNDNYDDAIKQLSKLGHFPDTYKLPNHRTFSNESIYSRGPMMGGNWVNDSTFSPSIINRQQYPNIYEENRPYTEREIYNDEYQQGGNIDAISGPDMEPIFQGGMLNPVVVRPYHDGSDWFNWWYNQRKDVLTQNIKDDEGKITSWLFPKRAERQADKYIQSIPSRIDRLEEHHYDDVSNASDKYKEWLVQQANWDFGKDDNITPEKAAHKLGLFGSSTSPANHFILYGVAGDKGTGVHEATHDIGPAAPLNLLREYRDYNGWTGKYKRQMNAEGVEFDSYLDSASEIRSRLNALRYMLNLDPKHKWSIKEIRDLKNQSDYRKSELDLDRYNDDFLLYLFNEVADNSTNNTSSNIAANGGKLGKVTPLGQWQHPYQVTIIPSNNITMKGVDYPVLGVSDTGDIKYMLPNMNYLFDGNYVTEYPVKKFQLGGITTGSYPTYNVPFSDADDHTWLKWWYSGRPNQIGNAYREYDISYNKNKRPKSLNKYNETGLNDINRSIDIAMKTPINFTSLRDNTLLGQYIPEGEGHIDIRRDQENHPSIVLHERVHALNENLTGANHVKSILGNFLQNPILMQISPETGTVDYREKLNGYVDSYWDNSNEIYSRLMQFRRDTRTSPLKKWNEEDIINLRKNKTLEKYNLDGYTNEFILHLFNDVADNNNKDYSTLV